MKIVVENDTPHKFKSSKHVTSEESSNNVKDDILSEIQKNSKVDLSNLTIERTDEVVAAFVDMNASMSKMNQLLNEIAEKNKAHENPEQNEDDIIADTIEKILIPMIDPNFKNRSKNLQSRIREIITNMYIIALSVPYVDPNDLIKTTIDMLNMEINNQ